MKTRFATFLIASGFASLALAQQEAAPAAEPAMALPAFAAVDGNEDGKIDMAEAKTLTESLEKNQSEVKFDFATADANEDGAVDMAEYKQYGEKAAMGDHAES